MYKLTFSASADKSLKKWKKSNPSVYKKVVDILAELVMHPRVGIGHPEPLKGCGGITYSRRITANDRMVYDIHDDYVEVIVLRIGGHYDDK